MNLDREILGQGFLLEGDPQALSDQLPQEMGPFPFLVFSITLSAKQTIQSHPALLWFLKLKGEI